MEDTLARERLPNNVIDRLERLERRMERALSSLGNPPASTTLLMTHPTNGLVYQLVVILNDGELQLALRRVQ